VLPVGDGRSPKYAFWDLYEQKLSGKRNHVNIFSRLAAIVPIVKNAKIGFQK
jgi:hypothetical protein